MRRWVFASALAMVPLAAVARRWTQDSPCGVGGNPTALGAVDGYVTLAQRVAAGDPDHQFRIGSVTRELREELGGIARDGWLNSCRFLVPSGPCQHRWDSPRRIIIVGDRPQRDAPLRLAGPAPATHAAGYSDGTIGLIPVAEFRALDRSKLVPLDDLLAGARP